jgi:hypothetical protein
MSKNAVKTNTNDIQANARPIVRQSVQRYIAQNANKISNKKTKWSEKDEDEKRKVKSKETQRMLVIC